MKRCIDVLRLVVFLGLIFCRVGAMPGVDLGDLGMPDIGVIEETVPAPTVTDTQKQQIDKRVTADLAVLSQRVAVREKLDLLNSILNYVGSQALKTQTQLNYCQAVSDFDAYARRFAGGRSLSKSEVSAIERFFVKLQKSTLVHAGALSSISAAVQFWHGVAKRPAGQTSHQSALARQRAVRTQPRR